MALRGGAVGKWRMLPLGTVVAAIALAPYPAGAEPAADSAPLDLIIAGGLVLDGTGAPARTAEIGIRGDRIVFIGARPQGTAARRIIDARGLTVAPGFIDPHTHSGSDAMAADPARRALENHLRQGVTTIVIGNDGGGAADVKATFAKIAARPPGANVATFVGFGAVRRAVLGNDARPPSPAELETMATAVASAMCDGALGLSAGLYYAPQNFAAIDEVAALAREAAQRGGLYETHLRDEGSASVGVMAALDEAIAIARKADRLPLHIAHIKALGVDAQGMAPQIIARIEAARASGLTITADQYPWDASSTGLGAALVPRWAMDGGNDRMVERLQAPTERLIRDMTEQLRIRGGAAAVLLVRGEQRGKRLDGLAREWKVTPVEAAVRVLISDPGAAIASFNMAAADIDAFAVLPWVAASSDASAGHPRRWGSFARRWRLYVHERPLVGAAEFVRRAAGFTAQALGIEDRGVIAAGKFADIAVFDPVSFAEQADYVAPDRPARGMRHVIVNGQFAVDNGELTGALAGRPLPKNRQSNWSCPE